MAQIRCLTDTSILGTAQLRGKAGKASSTQPLTAARRFDPKPQRIQFAPHVLTCIDKR